MKIIHELLATFLKIGYCPIAPGTAASLVVVLIYRFFLRGLSWPIYAALCGAIFVMGVWASQRNAEAKGIEDPRTIVIDEVLGQLVALFALHFTDTSWPLLLAAFLLFRFFDILKPLLIRRAERFAGGWGIMLDDLLAGLYSGILIQVYLHLA
jgi:phosphatidylglycerophosphatase A